MIPELRERFNREFSREGYASLLARLEERCGARVEFRVAETPIFMRLAQLEEMAAEGAALARSLMGNPAYLAAARAAIPPRVPRGRGDGPSQLSHRRFALIREGSGEAEAGRRGTWFPGWWRSRPFPRFTATRRSCAAPIARPSGCLEGLGCYLGGLDEGNIGTLLTRTILGGYDPENVVLTEVDPLNQKTRPDFQVTARRLGIAVVDIRSLEAMGDKLHYRNAAGRLVPIHRIYNRAIADELMAREVRLPFELTRPWDVEWAGHPNWYFLISQVLDSVAVAGPPGSSAVVPPAVFLERFS